MDMYNRIPVWVTVVYGLLGMAVYLLLLLAALWALRRVWRFLKQHRVIFGSDRHARLIGLAVALFLFRRPLAELLRMAFATLRVFLEQSSSGLAQAWAMAGNCAADEGSNCVELLVVGFAQAWLVGFGNALAALEAAPLFAGLAFFVVWALVGFLVDQVQLPSGEGGAEGPPRLDPRHLRNALFFLVLAIGAYLSTAAIVAIPELKAQALEAPEISLSALDQSLEAIIQDLTTRTSQGSESADPFLELRAALRARLPTPGLVAEGSGMSGTPAPTRPAPASPTPTPGPISEATASAITPPSRAEELLGLNQVGETAGPPPSPSPTPFPTLILPVEPVTGPILPEEALAVVPAGVLALREQLETYQLRRQGTLSLWPQLRQRGLDELRDHKRQAVNMYAISSLGRIGHREQVTHFRQLSGWFVGIADTYEDRLLLCRRSLDDMDQQLRAWASRRQQQLEYGDPAALQLDDVAVVFEIVAPFCNALPGVDGRVPERPDLGSALAWPFSLVASWLLRAELLPLALITGMIGFGLLGAAGSAFIRGRLPAEGEGDAGGSTSPSTPAPPAEPQPLVSDLTDVVVRGLSAAVVVFLGVMGGLAVFGGEGAEPNPYVLLFTCFVAAVYWDRVWLWARDQLERVAPSGRARPAEGVEAPGGGPAEGQAGGGTASDA